MVRRLERRARKAPRESLQHSQGRPPLQFTDAEGNRSKKTPSLGIQKVCDLWAGAQVQSQQHVVYVARDLAAQAGTLHPRQLNDSHVAALMARWKQNYAPATNYVRGQYLRALLRRLETLGAPRLEHLARFKPPQPRTVTLAPGELDVLLDAAPLHLKLFIHLCSQLALRFMEAYRLTTTDYNSESHTIRVLVKGGKTRTLPTTPEIETLINAARQGSAEATVIETLAGRSLQPKAIRAQFHALVKKTGVNPAINPHDMRRTTATRLYQMTKDLPAVQQMLGHDNLTSTLHYIAPLATENLKPLIDALRRPYRGPVQ